MALLRSLLSPLMGIEVGPPRATRVLRTWLALAVVGGTAVDALAEGDVPARLREVRAEVDRGKTERALELLEPLAAGELGDQVLLLRARLLREQGDLEAADAAAVAGLGRKPPSEVRARLHLERALVARARDRTTDAYREQRSAWETSRDREFSVERVVEQARAFEAEQLPGDALRLYELAWQRWPLARASWPAFDRARFLARATGAPVVPADPLLRRADRLRAAFECEPALATYQLLLARDDLDAETRWRAQSGEARCLFNRRRYPEALERFELLAKTRPEDPEPSIMVARTRARLRQPVVAAEALLEIARARRGAVRVRTQYLAAVLLRDRAPERSRKLMLRIERQKVVPAIAKAARWRLAWADLEAGNYAQAERRLRPLARGRVSDVEVQRARYWRAIARLTSDPEKGREKLSELAEAVPLDYYGLVAARHLGEASIAPKEFLGERDADVDDRGLRRAGWLVDGGFPELARDELESRLRGGSLSREERVAAALLLHRLGDHFRAVRVLIDGFGDALLQGIDPSWGEVWKLAWPRPYAGTVGRAVSEFGADPALVYAVMREESTYRPEAESPAGAIGLMQLVPPTASRIAVRLGVKGFEPEKLLAPDLNVRFGTYYLEELLSQFEGRRPLAIAAYNAGPEAVAQWVAAHDEFDAEIFVESIPYSETRRYLRKVLRSYSMYRLLYGEGSSLSQGDGVRAGSASQPIARADR